MSVTAQSVIKTLALDRLQDPTSKKWPVNQLVRYMNWTQRAICLWRPDAVIERHTMALAAGVKQSLPSGYLRVLDVVGNTAGRSCSMPPDGRALMDAQKPKWRNDTASDTIFHVLYDPREPLTFDVFPPATSSASLDLKLQKAVTDIAEPGTNTLWSDVTGNLSFTDDLLAVPLTDGILMLCFLKDAQEADQSARAQVHAQLMAAALGIEVKSVMQFARQTETA